MQGNVILRTLKSDSGQNLHFKNPIAIVTTKNPQQIINCLAQVDAYTQQGYYAAGYITYEAGCFMDTATAQLYREPKPPLLWFGIYKAPAGIPMQKSTGAPNNFTLTNLELQMSPALYQIALEKIKNYLHNGDTYQINFTTSYTGKLFGDIHDIFEIFCQTQEVDYAAYIQHDNQYILSVSPELFFSRSADQVTVKPMKGTASKETKPGWLKQDEKNLSENRMICDLLRNDLGKIAIPGSVKVTEAFAVEEYKTLWQMTSTITSQLPENTNTIKLLQTLFPSGSITGAPKVRSMEIIRELETTPRGVYTGAIGYIAPNQDAVFNVAIRTIQASEIAPQKYAFHYGVGSGITIDSDPKQEYDECLLKAKTLTQLDTPFAIIETMLCENGHIILLDKHLGRLQKSLNFFDICYSLEHILQAINQYIRPLTGQQRLRLQVSKQGDLTLEHQSMEISAEPVTLCISESHTNSQNIFLQHKTTVRELYTSEFAKYSALGFADVIFLNEREEVTEGAISNIFIKKSGQYYSPPLAAGLLPGIMREVFMQEHATIEKTLTLTDVRSAEEIFITNAVRGIRRAILQ